MTDRHVQPPLTGTGIGQLGEKPLLPYEWRKRSFPKAAAAVAATLAEHGIKPGQTRRGPSSLAPRR